MIRCLERAFYVIYRLCLGKPNIEEFEDQGEAFESGVQNHRSKWKILQRTEVSLRLIQYIWNKYHISHIFLNFIRFPLKLRSERDSNCRNQTIQTTVYDYFVSTRAISLSYSENLPCINVGKPNRAIFFPVEVILLICFLASSQYFAS